MAEEEHSDLGPKCELKSCSNLITRKVSGKWRKYCSRDCSEASRLGKRLGPRQTGPTSPQDAEGNYLCKYGHKKEFVRHKLTSYGREVAVYRCSTCRKIGAYMRLYSMDRDSATQAILAESGTCEICKKEGRVVVDHNHGTKEFRGFLCQACNSALGHFRDKPELILAGYKYLIEKGHYG